VLKKSDRKTDVVEYEKGIFEFAKALEVWDIRHIQLTMELALSYEARKEFFMEAPYRAMPSFWSPSWG